MSPSNTRNSHTGRSYVRKSRNRSRPNPIHTRRCKHKSPYQSGAFETMVAETAMAHAGVAGMSARCAQWLNLYGPALRCSVAAETTVVRLDPGDSEGVVVRRDPMACETGAAKTANMASAAETKTTDVASAAKTKTANMASAAKTKTANMASAAKTKTTDVASAAKTKTTDVAAKTKTANRASAAKTKTTDVASAAKTKTANRASAGKTKTTDVASAPKTKTTDVASAAQATDMASAAKATAPCERDCAGRCCRYAEHDGRTCCNQLLTHFSELLMFHLIWIASVQSLCSCCYDWFTIAPIWKDRQNQEVVQGMPLRAIARVRCCGSVLILAMLLLKATTFMAMASILPRAWSRSPSRVVFACHRSSTKASAIGSTFASRMAATSASRILTGRSGSGNGTRARRPPLPPDPILQTRSRTSLLRRSPSCRLPPERHRAAV